MSEDRLPAIIIGIILALLIGRVAVALLHRRQKRQHKADD